VTKEALALEKTMRKVTWLFAATLLAVLSACVTINVYFPAAEAEEAAAKFIDGVIGRDEAPQSPENAPSPAPRPLSFLAFLPIGTAHAQADIRIETPQIKAIQSRMAQRFDATLKPHFDSGALGLTNTGLVELRDAAAVPLAARTGVKQAVADENRDRDAVYREVAVANGHPEWEADIRSTFAKQWVERAPSGWYYQDAAGGWKRK
jgi:uncharacterized protein YdbL (DUF1318 family)